MTWKDRYRSYLEPWDPIRYGIWALYMSAKEIFQQKSYRVVFSAPQLLDLGFYKLFQALNERVVRFETHYTVIPDLVSQCSGTVLELGPGLGNQLCRFDTSRITRIIGVESNPYFAPGCKQKILEQGLEGIYELVNSGAQESDVLERHGVVAGSLDTVLSIQVLCSVPDADAMAKELYRLLKPGGRFIFWEHHRNSDWMTAAVQYLWNPTWRPLIGGCNMTRNMMAVIAAAGEWENYDSIEGDEEPWSMLPRVWGVLVKPNV